MEKFFLNIFKDPSLRITSHADWGATNPQYKELIYAALDQALQKSPKAFSSISHTHSEGGFAVSAFPVGFDVEITSRVTLDLLGRISTEKELSSAPDWASLWCAKEAAFKALKHFQQPKVVSQIEINFDQSDSVRGPIFRVENEKEFGASNGIGAIFRSSALTYCVFVFHKDF